MRATSCARVPPATTVHLGRAPALIPLAREVFDAGMPGPNQLHVARDDVHVEAADLLRPSLGTITRAGFEGNVEVCVRYLAAWLDGNGCVPIHHLMEDAATAEIARAQLWQWLHYADAGGEPCPGRRHWSISRCWSAPSSACPPASTTACGCPAPALVNEAIGLLDRLTHADALADFLTLPAYERLDRSSTPPFAAPHEDTTMKSHLPTAEQLKLDWANNPRWAGVTRTYSAEDVVRLRGTVPSSIRWPPRRGEAVEVAAQEDFVNALGAMTGNQAMQQVKAGLKAIYLSGWQVAADANLAGEMYPDQSLYPANSVPQVVKRINNTLLRADQLHHAEGDDSIDFLQPIVADAEAGFGGVLNAYELMKAMIEAGAAGVHFETSWPASEVRPHGRQVLVPTREAVEKLTARAWPPT